MKGDAFGQKFQHFCVSYHYFCCFISIRVLDVWIQRKLLEIKDGWFGSVKAVLTPQTMCAEWICWEVGLACNTMSCWLQYPFKRITTFNSRRLGSSSKQHNTHAPPRHSPFRFASTNAFCRCQGHSGALRGGAGLSDSRMGYWGVADKMRKEQN